MKEQGQNKKSKWKMAGVITGGGAIGIASLAILKSMVKKSLDIAALRKLSDRLEVIPTAKIHKVDFSGLTVRIDVTLKNPVNRGLKIRYPFVTVKKEDKTLGSSEAVDTLIAIPPNGQAVISGILLHFPLLGMFSLVSNLLQSLQSGQQVQLLVTVSTTVDPLWEVDPATKAWKALKDYGFTAAHELPYLKTKEINLKKTNS